MPETSTVWVVEQGEYSDYRVLGVFSSEAHAQLIADAINRTPYSGIATVAEWPLDPDVDALRQGFTKYLVQMQDDGTVDRCEPWEIGPLVNHDLELWRRSLAPAYVGKGIKDVLNGTVWAKDDAHAIKIANEHRTRMIANGEWVP